MIDLSPRELSLDTEWESPEQASNTLELFCIYLNYYFQGQPCDMELDDKW